MEELKEQIKKRIDSLSGELLELSHYIHENPEVGLEEYKSCKSICDLLEKHGCKVERNFSGLETAFMATCEGCGEGPHIVICAEYDALPKIGHGCGHNVIATCSTGAFLGLIEISKKLPGRVSIYGTPAEESVGGKKILLKNNAFNGVDFAIMMHPTSGKSIVARGGRTSGRLRVRFNGKSAHSAMPEQGVNALTCAVRFYCKLEDLKTKFEKGDNINTIILEGGVGSNIIPATSLLECNFRTAKFSRLVELFEIVKKIALQEAADIGASVEFEIIKSSYERFPNEPLSAAFKANLESLGELACFADNSRFYGSSDMNDVSVHIPIIHDYISISDEPIASHSLDFAKAAISKRADTVCIVGAKTLAMTAVDILVHEKLREDAQNYHKKTVPENYGSISSYLE